MRKLVFESYEGGNEEAKSYKIHLLLFNALYNSGWKVPQDDRAKVKAMANLLDAFDSISVKVKKDAMEQRVLSPKGGTLLLEDAEFDLFREGLKILKPGIPMGWARDVVATEEFLDNAETIKPSDLSKE